MKRRNKLLSIATGTVLFLQTASAYKDYDNQYRRYGGGLVTSCRYPGTQGYFLTEKAYPYSNASDACAETGGSLADLSNQNFLLASDLVLTCVGPNQRAWIGSWDYSANGNGNTQDCLSIFVGSIGPGGGLENICAGDKPVLCQIFPSTVPHNSSYSQPDVTNVIPAAAVSSKVVHGARRPSNKNNNANSNLENNNAESSVDDSDGDFEFLVEDEPEDQPINGVYHPRQPIFPTYDYNSQESYSRPNRPIPSVNHPRPLYPLPYTYPYVAPEAEGINYSRDSGYGAYHPPDTGRYPQGPHGGYPGGVYPGGPGYGDGGYPYGYPGKKGYIHNKMGHTVTQTVTVDGIIKTITLSGETTVTVDDPPYTVTLSNIVETVTLEGLLTTVTLSGEASTVTEIRNGEPATITVDGEPSTITEVIHGVPSTVTIDGVASTTTIYYTTTLTDISTLTVTDTVTLSDSNVTLAGTAVADVVTEAGVTTTVQQIITLTPEQITVAETTITLPATTSVVTLPLITTVLTLEGTTSTITIPGSAETITISGPESIVTLPPSTVTEYATIQVTETVPASTITVTQQATSEITSYVTITEVAQTVSVAGATTTETKYITVQGGNSVASTTSSTRPAVTLPGGFVLPNFGGPGIYTASPGNIVSISPNGAISWIEGGPSTTSAPRPAVTLPGGFVLPNFSGPGIYTASPGNVVSISPNGALSWIQGGPSATSASQPAVTLPGGFVLPNFSGPGIYTVSPGNVVSISPNGALSWIQGGPQSPSPTANSLPTVSLPGGYTISGFSGPGIYTPSPGNVVSISPNGALSWIQGGPPATSAPQPAVTLPGGFVLPNFSGPGIYTASPGNIVSISPNGALSWIQGGPSATSASQPAVTLPGGFVLPNFSGPGIYTASPGNVVSISPNGALSWIQGGPQSPSPTANSLPTVSLPGGYTISGFSGPGIYTPSPGNVVSISPNGALSWIQGGPPATSAPQPAVTLPGGFVLPNFSGPGIYTASPGNIVSISPNGALSWIQGGPSASSASQPAVTLPGGFVLPNFSGPGIYTPSPGNVVSISPNGALSWIQGGPQSPSPTANSLPTVSLPGGYTISGFSGPGIYTPSPGNVVSISPNGGLSWIQGGPSATSAPQPAVTLPGGFVLPNFSGPGIYTASPGNVVSISPNGALSWIQGGPQSASTTSRSLPTVSLPGGFEIPNFSGPGTYTLSPGNVVSVKADGSFTWLQGGPQSTSAGGLTLPSLTFPSITFPSITLPTLNLPTINLGNGVSLSGYTGAGTYTLGPGTVISLGSNGQFNYISGTGPNGSTGGSITLPSLSLPTLTLSGGINVPNYSGPGLYTVSPGNVVSIGAGGGVTWVQGGPQTNSNGGFTFPSFGFPTLTFPSITLPTLNLPTINLGNGISLSGYTGAGTYTLGPGSVISLGLNGRFNYISGTGPNGSTVGSITLPSLTLPTLTLSGGINVPNYSGPGLYTVSPGNVVSIGAGGGVTWVQGGPQTNSNGGFTFPSFGFPTLTFPSITLPTLNLPTINFGNGISLSGYTGAGTYTLGPGTVISLGLNGQFNYISGTGPNGNTGGSITLPSLTLPTLTLSGGINVPNYSGPGLYTVSPGNVVSIGAGGGVTWVQGGPQTNSNGGFTFPSFGFPTLTFPSITLPTLNLPTINLGNGISLSGYTGAGTYTLGPGSVISLGLNGRFNYISGTGPNGNSGGSITLPSLSLPTLTLSGGINVPNYSGPGLYTVSPGNVVSIGAGGGVTWVQGGPQTNSNGGFTFPSFGFPTLTFPSITLPTLNLPTVNLGNGISLSGYSGAGTYTLGPGSVISLGLNGQFNYISGTGPNGNTGGSITLPSLSLPTLTLSGGINVPNYSGPGLYTVSPGNVVSIGGGGGVTWVQGGPQTNSNGGFTFPSFGFPTLTFPSITLPTLNLPTINLGNGISLSGYTGAGTYSLGPGSVISLGLNGQFNYISGSGPNGNTGGSITLPPLSLPTLTLSGGINVPNYSGPGLYTVSPGNVVSIGAGGGVTWVQGGPQTNSNGGFTFPSIDFPTFGFPSVTLPSVSLATVDLGGGYTITNFKGPGTYTLGFGNVVSLSPDGSFSFVFGGLGNNKGSVTLPSVSLPTLTLSGGIPITGFSGPGTYTFSPGNVVSVDGNGRVTWIQGGPQSAPGGGFTFPTISLTATSTSAVQTAAPGSYVINGVTYSFPFKIPDFYGPGIYILSPGNVVQVNPDASYFFISGGPPSSQVVTSSAPSTSKPASSTAPTTTIYPITFPSITLPTVTFPSVNLFGNVKVSTYTGPGVYTVNGNSAVAIDSDGSYRYVVGNGPLNINSGSVGLPSLDLPTITLGGGITVPQYKGAGEYTISPGNILSIDANGGVKWIVGGPQSLVRPLPTYAQSITLPSISFPSLDIPSGGKISTFSGPGVYTINQNTVVSVDATGSYSYLVGNGIFGIKSGSLRIPTISYPTVSLPGSFSVTYSGPGTYTIDALDVVAVGTNGNLDWIVGGPLHVTPAAAPAALATTIGGVKYSFPFKIPNFTGPGIYVINHDNVVQVNSDGTYKFITGSAPPSVTGKPYVIPNLTLPTVNLPTATLVGITLPSYTGPGIYAPAPGNVIAVYAPGVISVITGTNLGPGATAGATISLPSVTVSPVSLPTITLPGNNVIQGYKGPGVYTINSGTVIEVGTNYDVAFLAGAPSTTLDGNGFTFAPFTLPKITFPAISLPSFGTKPASVTAAPKSMSTVIDGTTFTFPFSIPDFYGAGVYILSPGNVVQVNADGSYFFISGSAPKRIQLEPISVSGNVGEKSAYSEGFVLPGFSFSGFSRRAEPTPASSPNDNHAGPLGQILALF